MGTMMNPHGSVGIPWGFSNGFQITWKRVKYSAFFVICFTGNVDCCSVDGCAVLFNIG